MLLSISHRLKWFVIAKLNVHRRPKSPNFSTPSPKKESRKNVFEDAKPAADLEDDFNPREGEDFGDFKTADAVSTAKSLPSNSEAAKSGGGDDFFAVDFQAAFAGGSSNGSNQTSIPSATLGPASSQSLFSDNLTLVPPPSSAPPKPVSAVSPPSDSVDLLGLVFENSAPPASANSLSSPILSQNPTQTFSQPPIQNFQNSQPQQLFQQQQQSNLMSLDNILQPVVKSNVQSNNINNNSTLGSKEANSLKVRHIMKR